MGHEMGGVQVERCDGKKMLGIPARGESEGLSFFCEDGDEDG